MQHGCSKRDFNYSIQFALMTIQSACNNIGKANNLIKLKNAATSTIKLNR